MKRTHRVFQENEEERQRLLSTLEGQFIYHSLIEMDNNSNLPNKAWGDVRLAVTDLNKESFDVCKSYMDNVVQEVQQGRGIYIYGGVGTGKSTWAYKISRKYIATLAYNKVQNRQAPAVYFANVPELMNNLKEGFNDPQYMRELNYRIENSQLVVFDDIGAENMTEWTKEQLYHYINYRYSNGKATVFTANIPPNSLENRVADRIRGMTTVVEIKGQSRR